MGIESIERDIRDQIAGKIRLAAEGADRFRVFTPFVFDDGDHLAIVLRKDDAGWVLTDEGHTHMHRADDVDGPEPRDGTRGRIVADALAAFGIATFAGPQGRDGRDGRITSSGAPARAGARRRLDHLPGAGQSPIRHFESRDPR